MVKKIITILLSLLLVGGITYYNAAYVNCRTFSIREETLRSKKISKDLDGLLICCFSDLYYGDLTSDDYLRNVFETIDFFDPDIILFEGDLLYPGVEIPEEKRSTLIEMLSGMDARYGKYAVYGDQDHLDHEEVDEILSASGFTVLNNANTLISVDRSGYINLVGIDSLVSGEPDPTTAFSGSNTNYYTFAISHCPDIFDSVSGYGVDLLSAGHSRGYQIYIPLISYFTREYGYRKYARGKNTKNGSTLDINNGIGRYINDARLFADAEIVLYTLRPLN